MLEFLLQGTSTAECRAVFLESLLRGYKTHQAGTLKIQGGPPRALPAPVGSVEFVREYMAAMSIEEPALPSLLGSGLYPHLHRELLATTKACLARAPFTRGLWFLKPARTKRFSGFVWTGEPARTGLAMSYSCLDHFEEQCDALRALPADEPLLAGAPVRFLREDRFYVLEGDVVGQGRYDPYGEDDAPSPDPRAVQAMLRAALAAGAPCAFALDVGVLETGQSALVELNDAWALGLYAGMARGAYVRMLAARWREIAAARTPAA